ncbi:MAG: DUF4136 domain-containing protein [Rikenellaceae bacterium]|nr:DUF4136 domain-containing protein [Rikenellaceae bacterium]
MKRVLYVIIALLALSSCRHEPETADLDNKFMVYTSHDHSANFATFSTFYLPDSILLISAEPTPQYWKDADAQRIITAYATNMTQRGYTRTADKAGADLGIQISYVQSTRYLVDYHYEYWWWGYPGYWGPGYWGNWGGWYYPYPIYYTYQVGSMLTEVVDLKAPEGEAQKLPVLWTSFVSGLLDYSQEVNTSEAVEAVNQSFTQSPYLKK